MIPANHAIHSTFLINHPSIPFPYNVKQEAKGIRWRQHRMTPHTQTDRQMPQTLVRMVSISCIQCSLTIQTNGRSNLAKAASNSHGKSKHQSDAMLLRLTRAYNPIRTWSIQLSLHTKAVWQTDKLRRLVSPIACSSSSFGGGKVVLRRTRQQMGPWSIPQ